VFPGSDTTEFPTGYEVPQQLLIMDRCLEGSVPRPATANGILTSVPDRSWAGRAARPGACRLAVLRCGSGIRRETGKEETEKVSLLQIAMKKK